VCEGTDFDLKSSNIDDLSVESPLSFARRGWVRLFFRESKLEVSVYLKDSKLITSLTHGRAVYSGARPSGGAISEYRYGFVRERVPVSCCAEEKGYC
jgi:hypothetical protein